MSINGKIYGINGRGGVPAIDNVDFNDDQFFRDSMGFSE